MDSNADMAQMLFGMLRDELKDMLYDSTSDFIIKCISLPASMFAMKISYGDKALTYFCCFAKMSASTWYSKS